MLDSPVAGSHNDNVIDHHVVTTPTYGNYACATSNYARIRLTTRNYSLHLILCLPNRRSPTLDVSVKTSKQRATHVHVHDCMYYLNQVGRRDIIRTVLGVICVTATI